MCVCVRVCVVLYSTKASIEMQGRKEKGRDGEKISVACVRVRACVCVFLEVTCPFILSHASSCRLTSECN